MPIVLNEPFDLNYPLAIDSRLIVDRVSGATASLEALIPQYNYRNMIVWVREDKAFYYLRDNPNSPSNPGITFSDWILFSGGGGATTSCTKSGYISGDNFTTNGSIATASVTFQVPYLYASYSVAVTGLTNYDILGDYDDYVFSVFNRSTTGFDIQVNVGAIPLGATAMWIASCFEGSNDIAPGGFGAQGPTGPGGSTADTAGRRGWESGQSFSTPSGGYTLTASSTASTIFFPISNSFDSPQGDIVVTLDPNLAISDINRNFRLVVDNLQRIESGSTWSIVAPMEGFDPGDRILEWSEGRIEPQVLEFVWNDSARSGLGGYEMFRYLAEPFVRNNLSGSASSRDFTTTKRQTGFFGGSATVNVSSSGSSTVYPAGSILFIKEAFVTCEGNTTTGVTVSFGLRESNLANIATSQFTPDLTTFDISLTADRIIFPNKSLNDFATGSVFYSDSPVGVVRINRPMMIYMTLTGGSLQPGTFLKCVVPYIVDEFSFTVASGLGGQIASPNNQSGSFAIDLEEIAFGTGTGITSSNLFTFDNSNTSLILGFDNTITNSRSSAIIGGTGNTINSSTFIGSNLITSAKSSCIRNSFYSSIQSSDKSIICNSTHSTIITSSTENCYGAKICNSKNAAIINSPRSCIINTNGSYKNRSRQFIIGGYLHTMCQKEGTGENSGYLGGSGILGGAGNCMYTGGVHSLILGGRCNVLKNLNYYDVFGGNPSGLGTEGQMFCGGRSVIVGGENNLLIGPKVNSSVIIGGCTNSITSGTIFSTIVGGCRNTIATSSNSTIIGGVCNSMTASNQSLILGGCNLQMNGINNMVYVPSIRGFGSVQLDLKTSSTDYELNQNNYTLLTYPTISGMTVSLPTASTAPHRLYVIKKDSSSTQSIVYISPQPVDSIEGYSGSIELINPWDYNILQSDGVNLWIKLGGAVGLNL